MAIRSITFQEAWDRFISAHKGEWRANTKRNYESAFRKSFRDGLSDRALNSIKMEDAQTLLGGLTCGPVTRKLYATYLRRFFNWAIDNDLALKNPLARLKYKIVDQAPVFPLTTDEAYKVLQAAKKLTLPNVYKAVAIGLYTGLRSMNVIGMDRHHVLWDRKLLSFSGAEMKGRFPLTVPFHPALEDFLTDLPLGLDRRNLQYNCNLIATRSGVARFHFHLLRHTFASWTAAVAPEAVLVALLGHRSGRNTVTAQYIHVTDDQMRDALLKLPMLL